MSQVFVSYRHVEPDEGLADRLCAYLVGRGLRVFLDKRIEVGLDWAKEIDRQLRASSFLVVLLSEESIRSDMVRQEIETAHELLQQGKMTILPISAVTAALSPDGRTVLAVTDDGGVQLWNRNLGQPDLSVPRRGRRPHRKFISVQMDVAIS